MLRSVIHLKVSRMPGQLQWSEATEPYSVKWNGAHFKCHIAYHSYHSIRAWLVFVAKTQIQHTPLRIKEQIFCKRICVLSSFLQTTLLTDRLKHKSHD